MRKQLRKLSRQLLVPADFFPSAPVSCWKAGLCHVEQVWDSLRGQSFPLDVWDSDCSLQVVKEIAHSVRLINQWEFTFLKTSKFEQLFSFCSFSKRTLNHIRKFFKSLEQSFSMGTKVVLFSVSAVAKFFCFDWISEMFFLFYKQRLQT